MQIITLSLFIVVLIAIIGFQSVSSYQCYECQYPGDRTCLDPFTSTKLSDLTNYPVCSKAKGHVNGQDILARAGVPSGYVNQICLGGNNGCKKGHQGSQNAEICCCTGDRCNGGNAQVGKLHLVGLVAGAAIVLRLFF